MDNVLALQRLELERHVCSFLTAKVKKSLVNMCRDRGLLVGGRKAELIDRLHADILERGWTVEAESDLWRDAALGSDSFVSSPTSKMPRRQRLNSNSWNESISREDIVDEANRGLDVVHPNAFSSFASIGPSEPGSTTRSSTVGPLSLPLGSPKVKFVPLVIDDVVPRRRKTAKRTMGDQDSALDSRSSARPMKHMTRRALKDQLRRTPDRRSGSDFLAENNATIVQSTLSRYNEKTTVVSPSRLNIAATSFAAFLDSFLDNSHPSEDCVCWSVGNDTLVELPDPIDIESRDSFMGMPRSVVATLTSDGFPVAVVTTPRTLTPFSRLEPDADKVVNPVIPAIDWIRLSEPDVLSPGRD